MLRNLCYFGILDPNKTQCVNLEYEVDLDNIISNKIDARLVYPFCFDYEFILDSGGWLTLIVRVVSLDA